MELPTPYTLQSAIPLTPKLARFVYESRKTALQIMQRKDPRLALIIGPCSLHDRTSALEYAARFKKLADRVSKNCYLLMRVYGEKPRTALGWKGLIYDPHLDGSHDITTGLIWMRELLIHLAEMGVPAATEFVDPLAAHYFADCISWGFIGARTSASQIHRQFASALSIPVGFKNATDGTIDEAINGVISAKASHSFLNVNSKGNLCAMRSEGNPYAHVVLRGSTDAPNYDKKSVEATMERLKEASLPPRLLIDCSHGNCQKQFEKQKEVFRSVIELAREGNSSIIGLMLESHLEAGNQPLTENLSALRYAVSITDPCLDWESTEELVCWADEELSSSPAGSDRRLS